MSSNKKKVEQKFIREFFSPVSEARYEINLLTSRVHYDERQSKEKERKVLRRTELLAKDIEAKKRYDHRRYLLSGRKRSTTTTTTTGSHDSPPTSPPTPAAAAHNTIQVEGSVAMIEAIHQEIDDSVFSVEPQLRKQRNLGLGERKIG